MYIQTETNIWKRSTKLKLNYEPLRSRIYTVLKDTKKYTDIYEKCKKSGDFWEKFKKPRIKWKKIRRLDISDNIKIFIENLVSYKYNFCLHDNKLKLAELLPQIEKLDFHNDETKGYKPSKSLKSGLDILSEPTNDSKVNTVSHVCLMRFIKTLF